MSTEIVILGVGFAKTTVFNFSGCFGGYFPFVYDILHRQKQPTQEKIALDVEFFMVKAVVTPLMALIVTALAVAFESVNTWLAALYLGASLPVLVEKVLGSSNATVSNLGRGQ